MRRGLRIYVDTSVFGGAKDAEFAEATGLFFDRVRTDKCILLLSEVTYSELEGAPAEVRQVLADFPRELIEDIPVDPETRALAQAYIDSGAIGAQHGADADHVAVATVAGADLIVSWNFKHIVNVDRIRRYNAVNLLNGYNVVEIRSPREIAYGEET